MTKAEKTSAVEWLATLVGRHGDAAVILDLLRDLEGRVAVMGQRIRDQRTLRLRA